MQYWTCPLCGANLDRNEKCDCEEQKAREEAAIQDFLNRHFKMEPKSGQFSFMFSGGGGRCG